MRVALFVPIDKRIEEKEAFIPMGIAYINGALRTAGIDVCAYNLNYIDEDVDVFLKKLIEKEEISCVLCGGTSYNYGTLKYIYQMVKQFNENIVTIGGGAGFTSHPQLFAQMTGVDCAVLGEGEVTTVELLRAIEEGRDFSDVPGIIYRKGDEYIRTKEREVISDIDTIPFPSYEGLGVENVFQQLKEYNDSWHFDYEDVQNPRVLPMIFGRSCPYNCKFCFHTMGRKHRARSLDNFFEELDMLIEKYHLTGITIMDEFFGVQEDVILEFCERIKAYHLKWFAEIRVDVVSEKVLSAMKNAGCTNILLGLESMSPEILSDMRKRITPEQIENALEIAYKLGIRFVGNFIFGTEEETMESFYQTFDWWNSHRKYQVCLITLRLYPGCDYYKNAVINQKITDQEKYIAAGMPEINISKLTDYEWDKVKRIINLSNIDTVMEGKVLDVSQIDEKMYFRLRCRHCGNEFSAEVFTGKRRSLEKFWYVCPECEQKARYSLQNNYEPCFEKEIYYQLALNNSNGYYMKDWLETKGYSNIVLWGKRADANVSLMITEIRNAGKKLLGISGENTYQFELLAGDWGVDSVISVEDIVKMGCDVIIICETVNFVESVRYLRSHGYSGKIDFFVNLVLQHDYFIEENIQ